MELLIVSAGLAAAAGVRALRRRRRERAESEWASAIQYADDLHTWNSDTVALPLTGEVYRTVTDELGVWMPERHEPEPALIAESVAMELPWVTLHRPPSWALHWTGELPVVRELVGASRGDPS